MSFEKVNAVGCVRGLKMRLSSSQPNRECTGRYMQGWV